jgi:GNAT superfamily N-acetyltransferase
MNFKQWLESKWVDINNPPQTPYYELEKIPKVFHKNYGLSDGDWFWLSKVYVPPERRRAGIGRDIVRKAQDEAGEGNILIRVEPIDNSTSIESLKKFYRSLGFRDYQNNYMVWVNPSSSFSDFDV